LMSRAYGKFKRVPSATLKSLLREQIRVL